MRSSRWQARKSRPKVFHIAPRVRHSELSPRCVGAAARRAGLSPLHCDAPISRRPVCLLQHTFHPIGSLTLGGFSRVLADGSFLEFLNLKTQDLSPLDNRQQAFREDLDPRSSRSIFYFLYALCVVWTVSFLSAARAKNF